MAISIHKPTVIQVIQPTAATSHVEANVTIQGTELKQVETMKYLGSIISQDASLDAEIDYRVTSAWGKHHQLAALWKNPQIKRNIKARIFDACVSSRLLYGCATWAITPGQLSKLNFAYILMVCKALHIQRRFPGEDGSWSSISYREVLRAAGLEDLQVKIDTRTLKFAGHVARMGPDRNPNRLLFNNATPTGSHSYTHTVAAAATRADIAGSWQVTAQIRSYWSQKIASYISRSNLGKHKRKR